MRNAWIALAVVASALAACGGEPERYTDYRETQTEEIPGSWGLIMSPPDDGYNPHLSPAQVLDRFSGDAPRGGIMLTLANLTSELTPVLKGTPLPVSGEPAWVLLSRGVCFSSEKGALVASARRPDSYNAERCSLKNISVLAVNADTGDFIASERAFDETLEWAPARAGHPTLPGTSSSTLESPADRPASRASNIQEAPDLLSPSP